MARTRTSGSDARGFTLLELLVVLAVVALIAAVVVPAIGTGSSSQPARRAAWDVAAALRTARADAIRRNGESVLTLDVDERTYSVGDDETARPLPEDVTYTVLTAEGERKNESRASIRFFADGSSTGGRVTMKDRVSEYVVGVEWLTGRVRIHD